MSESGGLMVHCRNGSVDAAKELIKSGLSIDTATDENPITAAIENDDGALMALLLDSPATLQFQPAPGFSILWLAAANGCEKVMHVLLSRGFLPSAFDIVTIASSGPREMLSPLISAYRASASKPLLHCIPMAMRSAQIPVHQLAMAAIVAECRAAVNDPHEGKPPLLRAAAHANACLVSALLEARADVDARGADGRSPLMAAAALRDPAALDAVLTAGPRVNGRDCRGWTAMHFAVDASALTAVRKLLAAGAGITAATQEGRTALFFARTAAMVHALLDAGAAIDHRARDGDTAVLYTAVDEVMDALISRKADVGVVGSGHNTVLIRMVRRGDVGRVRHLLRLPAVSALVNASCEDGTTALSVGVASLEMARALVDSNADVNQPMAGGSRFTPLALACSAGSAHVAALLMARGADMDARVGSGQSVLMLAVAGGHTAVVEHLLVVRTPALLDAQDCDGCTALKLAVEKNLPVIVRSLVAAGANVRIADLSGTSPLMECRDAPTAALLLDHGASNAQNASGSNALMAAVRRGATEVVQLLLARGADPSLADRSGDTALTLACARGCVEAVQALLSTPQSSVASVAWIDAQRRDLRSALHVAVQHQQHSWPLTLMLVEAGANTNLVDWEGCTALHYAQSADVAALLLRRGARDAACQRGFTALMKACERGDAALTSLLLSYGSDVDAMAYDGVSSPLSITAANGALDVLCVLLDATPPPDVNLRSIAGQTPLFDAVANKQPQAVDLLLDAGADPSAADDNGASPLMLVADPESLGYLVAAAPQAVAQRDRRGRTVLAHLCADPGSSGVLKALFLVCDSHGVKVDVDAADEQGETALHVAVAGLNVEAVRVLLGRRAQVSGSCREGMTALMKLFPGRNDGALTARSVGAAQECLDLMLQQLAGDEQPEAKRRRYRRTFLSNRRH